MIDMKKILPLDHAEKELQFLRSLADKSRKLKMDIAQTNIEID